jgi:hypothetical protein
VLGVSAAGLPSADWTAWPLAPAHAHAVMQRAWLQAHLLERLASRLSWDSEALHACMLPAVAPDSGAAQAEAVAAVDTTPAARDAAAPADDSCRCSASAAAADTASGCAANGVAAIPEASGVTAQ